MKTPKQPAVPTKCSVVLSAVLHEQLQVISEKKGLSLSDVIRKYLEDGVHREKTNETFGTCVDRLTLHLDPVMALMLFQTSQYLRLSLENVIQTILIKHLPEELASSKAIADNLEKLVLTHDHREEPRPKNR